MYIVYIRNLETRKSMWEGIVPSHTAAGQILRGLSKISSKPLVMETIPMREEAGDLVLKWLEDSNDETSN